MSLGRCCLAEFIGTMALLACIVGSGVMGMNLAQGNQAIALLANAGATAGLLYVLISIFGPISGAHFNPVVSAVQWGRREITGAQAVAYIASQVAGALFGVVLAHAMFALPLVQPGVHEREGVAQVISEFVATFGLLLTILLGGKVRRAALPALVAAYIFAAYWFTASTSFANPAVTIARSMTRTFAGIRPQDAPWFIIGQLAGGLLALLFFKAGLLCPTREPTGSTQEATGVPVERSRTVPRRVAASRKKSSESAG